MIRVLAVLFLSLVATSAFQVRLNLFLINCMRVVPQAASGEAMRRPCPHIKHTHAANTRYTLILYSSRRHPSIAPRHFNETRTRTSTHHKIHETKNRDKNSQLRPPSPLLPTPPRPSPPPANPRSPQTVPSTPVRSATSMSATMSKSVPFLTVPANTKGWVGDVEFDPFSFSENFDMNWLREAEIKHGRVSMLGEIERVSTLPTTQTSLTLSTLVVTQPPSVSGNNNT